MPSWVESSRERHGSRRFTPAGVAPTRVDVAGEGNPRRFEMKQHDHGICARLLGRTLAHKKLASVSDRAGGTVATTDLAGCARPRHVGDRC